MKIIQLTLKSFGRFQNRTIDLQAGINVVSGVNEAGKTTMHQMIEAMFYGFYKPNIRTRKLSESYDRYLPWQNGNEFAGVMVIEDGRLIRIERSFMKNRDEVLIYDHETGEDITASYPYDPVTRQHQPGLKHLGMNLSTYRNTVSIAQMQNRTTEELVMAIKENVLNLGETRSIDVSLDNVFKQIQERRSAVGTPRSKKSALGMATLDIEQLETERVRLKEGWNEIGRLKEQEEAWQKKITTLEQVKTALDAQMAQVKTAQDEARKHELEEIGAQIDAIKGEISKIEYVAVVSAQELREVLVKQSRLGSNQANAQILSERIYSIKSRLGVIVDESLELTAGLIEPGQAEHMTQDILKYDALQHEINKEEGQDSLEAIGDFEQAHKQLVHKRHRARILAIVLVLAALVLGAISAIGFFAMDLIQLPYQSLIDAYRLPIAVLSGVSLAAAIGMAIRLRSLAKKIHVLERELHYAREKQSAFQIRKGDLLAKQLHLLKQYDLNDISMMKMERDNRIKAELKSQNDAKRLEDLRQESDRIYKDLTEYELQYSQMLEENESDQQEVTRVRAALGMHDEADFGRALTDKERLDLLWADLRNKQTLYETVMSRRGYIYGEETGADEISDDMDSQEQLVVEETHSLESLNRKQRQVLGQLLIENRHFNQLCGEIRAKEVRLKPIALVEEDLAQRNREAEQLNYRLEVLDLIEEAVTNVADQIHNSFAPELNEKVSRLVSTVTDYKYADIKITTDLNMTVLDQENHKFVPVQALSAGTLDLMYLALRLSLAELVSSGQNLPVILDDSFVQYDDRRLVKALEALGKTSRQVLLLTCHKRELEILERMQERPHVVYL